MEQNESKGEQYPCGRGYGHDYMRGGEVFGGYGYQERDAYGRPRGTLGLGDAGEGDAAPHAVPADDGMPSETIAPNGAIELPQDEQAGHWPVPHDLDDDVAARPTDVGEPTDAPVPQIEHTFGDTGGNRMHSRSYYVTQAQLQQRVLKANRDEAVS